MYKTQMRFQKILCFAVLAVCVIVFLYALGVMTQLYDTLFTASDPELDITYVDGADLFYDMQPFNKTLLTVAIVLLLLSLSLFVFQGHVRRKYYIANYVTTGLCCVAFVAAAIWGMANVAIYRGQFLAIDFASLQAWAEMWNTRYSESTLWFDLGFVVFLLLVVAAALLVVNTIWKVKLMKAETAALDADKEVAA